MAINRSYIVERKAGLYEDVFARSRARTETHEETESLDQRRLLLALLALFPPYLFVASSVVSSMQSRHRAAAEFAMLFVAGNGLRILRRWRTARSSRRVPASAVTVRQ